MVGWREAWVRFKNVGHWPRTEQELFEPEYEKIVEETKAKVEVKHGLDIILGHEKIKKLVRRALVSEEAINILMVGQPASAKSLFLKAITEEYRGDVMYFDGTNTTNRILIDMDKRRPKVICIDEFEKMRKNYRDMLLLFAETGRIKVTQINRQLDFTIPGCKIFATANELNRITKPMASRFAVLHMPTYTEEQFVEISRNILEHTSIPSQLQEFIGHMVYRVKGDLRQVLRLGKLVLREDTEEDVIDMVEAMNEQGQEGEKEKK